MKRIHMKFNTLLSCSLGLLLVGMLWSCELSEIDNYPGPNATISGGIYDMETGELVEQDIIKGMQIEYIEDGYDNPEIQYMVVKNDGTYLNKLMFANTYSMRPVRGNFVPVGSKGVRVQGDTKVDFQVLPYIRIKNAEIKKEGNKVIATFNLQQTVPNKTSKIGLYAHKEENVGLPLNVVAQELVINAVVEESTTYRLEIDLEANSNKLLAGQAYFFRIGALMGAPEAKPNYAPAVRINL